MIRVYGSFSGCLLGQLIVGVWDTNTQDPQGQSFNKSEN